MRSLYQAGLALSLATLVGCGGPSVTLKPNDTITNPEEMTHDASIEFFEETNKVIIPTAYVQTLAKAQHKASKGGAHATVNVSNDGIDSQLAQRIADTLYADLVSRLKADGWEVLGYETIKDHGDVQDELEPWPVEEGYGFPVYSLNWGFGDNDYLVASPGGMPTWEYDMLRKSAPVWDINDVAEDMEAVLAVPTYRFHAPELWGDTGRGYKNTVAEAGLNPVMRFPFARIDFVGVKGYNGSFGFVPPTNEQWPQLADNIGTLEKVSSQRNYGGWIGLANSTKGNYVLKVDTETYYNAAVKAGKDFNAMFAEALAQIKAE